MALESALSTLDQGRMILLAAGPRCTMSRATVALRETKRMQIIRIAAVAAAALFTAQAYAAATCESQATDRKLYGAARDSFVKKCIREGCEATAADKKLHGAAKNSSVDKCIREATPAPAPAAAKK